MDNQEMNLLGNILISPELVVLDLEAESDMDAINKLFLLREKARKL